MDLDFLKKPKVVGTSFAIFLFIILLVGGRIFFEWKASRNPPPVSSETLPGEIENLILDEENDDNAEKKEAVISPLSGEIVAEDSPIIAVVIENHPFARDQMRGLVEAKIVIEALAEGGITRFLAFFDETNGLEKVGPVRSIRPYFVDWSSEIAQALVHAGGSDEALELFQKTTLQDFDEGEEDDLNPPLFRDIAYKKPHNLFANLEKVAQAIKKIKTPLPRFNFGGKIPATAGEAEKIKIDFSLPSYLVNYAYDQNTQTYKRQVGGHSHTDASGNPVQPKNIIVQFVPYQVIDDAGRLAMETRGEGVAWYFSQGKFWKGGWQKTGPQTKFFTREGKELSLSKGQTFIEILDDPKKITLE